MRKEAGHGNKRGIRHKAYGISFVVSLRDLVFIMTLLAGQGVWRTGSGAPRSWSRTGCAGMTRYWCYRTVMVFEVIVNFEVDYETGTVDLVVGIGDFLGFVGIFEWGVGAGCVVCG